MSDKETAMKLNWVFEGSCHLVLLDAAGVPERRCYIGDGDNLQGIVARVKATEHQIAEAGE